MDIDWVDCFLVRAKEKILTMIARGEEPAFHYLRSPVYYIENVGSGVCFYCLCVRGDLVHFVRLRNLDSDLIPGKQLFVWEATSCFQSGKFAEYLFFNILVHAYEFLTADTEQPNSGKRFWSGIVHTAFKEEFTVHRLDYQRELTLLESKSDYSAQFNGFFKHPFPFKETTLAIRQSIPTNYLPD